jgi:hypothetical protein
VNGYSRLRLKKEEEEEEEEVSLANTLGAFSCPGYKGGNRSWAGKKGAVRDFTRTWVRLRYLIYRLSPTPWVPESLIRLLWFMQF